MPMKKPSATPVKVTKTVSAKAAKPAPKAAAKEKAAPRKVASNAKTVAAPAVNVKSVVAKPATSSRPASAGEKIVVRVQPEPAVDSSRAEESDFEMSPSLLSGPRNVQPYQIRKGEEYMSKEQLDHFRLILSSWKQDLMQEVDRTVLHMKDEAANFPDPNDRATQESEFSLELRTRDRERKLIRKIDEALKRIDDGSYGFCLETGEPIGVKRLEARPVATLSVEAQERRERREKQFGDRDDFYR
jgi:DnaK suppressor protein